MKRIASLFLAICMLLSLLTVGVSAADTRDGLADGYYLNGTHNNWDVASLTETLRFHESNGDPDEFILETTLTQGQAFKVVKVENGAVTAWYPDGVNNDYVVDAEHAGPAILYFRDSYHGDWADNGGYVWVGGKPAVSYVDENGVTQSCTEYSTANYAGTAWSGWIVVHENTTLSDFNEWSDELNVWVNDRINLTGDVRLILMDDCTLTVPSGIHVPNGSSLTIYAQENGTGILTAHTVANQAAIGGNNNENVCGDITINGGTVNADGSAGDCTGIGGGFFGDPGTITINGGTVNALGGDGGNGIGHGDSAMGTGTIIINDGVVNATGGNGFAGIGIGDEGTVIINGGTVNATGGEGGPGASMAGDGGGAGIGGDPTTATPGTIEINGGTVTATGKTGAAGIGGGGNAGGFVTITITGGVVTATGSESSPAIGATPDAFEFGAITISGGQVTAISEDADCAVGGHCTWFEALSTINLGWTEASDFILASSYDGVVTLDKEWAVDGSDETFEAGVVEDVSTLAGKKLVPPAPAPVEPIETNSLRLFRNVSIGTDMLITFSILESNLTDYDSWYIQVTKDGLEGSETYLYGPEACSLANGTYAVDFTHISAKEMGVMYHAQVFAMKDGVAYCGPVREGSMKQYLASTLTSTDSSVSATLKTLAADMLNYGAAAQSFLNYDTLHLVNVELSETELTALHNYETTGEASATKTNTNTVPTGEPRLLYTSVAMTNRVELGLFVSLNNLSGWQDAQSIEVQMKDHETQQVVAVLPTVLNANGTQMDATFPGVGAKNMRTEYDFVTLVDGVERGNIRTWSIEGYVNQLRNDSSSSDALKALANAVLIYGDSAQRYLDAQ